MEDVRIAPKDNLRCAVCETDLSEDSAVRNNHATYCRECWNNEVLKDRKILPVYAFFVAFILFQLFFYMPAMMHDTRGWSSPLHFTLCGGIGLLCGMLAYEIVYRRITSKLVTAGSDPKSQPRNAWGQTPE